jgi:hypothetical protein
MQKTDILAAALLASGLLGTSVGAMAQSSSQSSSQSNSNQSDLPSAPTPVAPAKDKSKRGTTLAANPSQSTAPAADSSPSATPPPKTDTPQAPAKKPSTAEDNPFPEDISAKAAVAAKAAATDSSTPNAPVPANPTPAEKQAQGSSSLDNTDKLGLDDPARKQLKLESPDGGTDVYDPKRATEDVRVGKFYMQTGHYKGAYDRFKDAATFDHENVEAVFYLAQAAQKLNMQKEAAQNYQLYLAAVPDGPSAKAAKKALGELGSSSKP